MSGFGTGQGMSPRRRRGTKTDRKQKTESRTRRFSVPFRYAAAAAERYLEAPDPEPLPLDDVYEFDDAPPPDDVPEWSDDQDDRGAVDDDSDAPVTPPGWLPWVRLTISLDGDQVKHWVHLPSSEDPELEQSLVHQHQAWSALAEERLIPQQKTALRQSSPLEALLVLQPYAMKDLERSAGQGSRDRRVLINTPFGLAPLWFFAQGRSDRLYSNLIRLVRFLRAADDPASFRTAGGTLRMEAIRAALPQADESMREAIRKGHGPTVIAVVAQPDVVARHRARWPMATPDSLVDALGVTGRTGRSQACATLALLGAFDTPHQLTAVQATRPSNKERQP